MSAREANHVCRHLPRFAVLASGVVLVDVVVEEQLGEVRADEG